MSSSSPSTSYWGEIAKVRDTDSGIAALEREQITKPKPMEVEGHLLHQPSNRHYPPTNEVLSSDSFKMDPLVLHTIRLLQHTKKAKTAVDMLQYDIKSESEPTAVNIGPIPDYDGPPIKDRTHHKYFTQEHYQSDFVRGIGKAQPCIDESTSRKLLRRSTAALCAHLDIDSAPESVLDTLTDVGHEFLLQITKHLGAASDRRALYGPDGFPDCMERVLHEMGVGSSTNLLSFYQQRVIGYHQRVKRQCQAAMAEYSQHSARVGQPNAGTATTKTLSNSPSVTGDTLQLIRIKEEPSAFSSLLDGKDDGGRQMLNIENLGPFEIVEQEIPTGLTTEMKGKGSNPSKGTASVASKLSVWSSVEESSENGESNDPPVTLTQPAIPSATSTHTPEESSSSSLLEKSLVSGTDTLAGPSKSKKRKK